MADSLTRIRLTIGTGPDADDAAREELALNLKREVEDLAVESVERVRGLAPADAGGARPKGGPDPVILGDLLVQLVAAGGVLTTLIGVVQNWLTRHERSSVKLEIDGDALELTGVTPEQKRRLIETWISRHSLPKPHKTHG